MILANNYSAYSDLKKLNKMKLTSAMILANNYSAYSDMTKLNKIYQM